MNIWVIVGGIIAAHLLVAVAMSPLIVERKWWARRMKARHRG